MDVRPGLDLHDVYANAAKTQLAMLDFSIAWWETVLVQGVTCTELCSQTLESLRTGGPALADSVRRLGDFGVSNSVEFGKLSAHCCGIVLQALAGTGAPPRRARVAGR
jgi:hypothetical protein